MYGGTDQELGELELTWWKLLVLVSISRSLPTPEDIEWSVELNQNCLTSVSW